MRRDEIAVIVDEVFADYELEPGAADGRGRPLQQTDCLAFSLGGLSKTVGLPQAKLGWIAAGGPDRLVAEALTRLEFVCDTYLSVSTPVQAATAELLEAGGPLRTGIQLRVTANYGTLRTPSRQSLPARCSPPKAAGTRVVQVPSFSTEEDLVLDLLTTHGVLVHPGYFFDFPRESFLIVSLLVARAGVCRRHRPHPAALRLHGLDMHEPADGRRRAGLLIPLFSCPSTASWGIGEIGDLEPVARWLAAAGSASCSSCRSTKWRRGSSRRTRRSRAMAIDPIYIRVAAVPEFVALGGEASAGSRRSRAARAGASRRRAWTTSRSGR